jgi:hypothetical protein
MSSSQITIQNFLSTFDPDDSSGSRKPLQALQAATSIDQLTAALSRVELEIPVGVSGFNGTIEMLGITSSTMECHIPTLGGSVSFVRTGSGIIPSELGKRIYFDASGDRNSTVHQSKAQGSGQDIPLAIVGAMERAGMSPSSSMLPLGEIPKVAVFATELSFQQGWKSTGKNHVGVLEYNPAEKKWSYKGDGSKKIFSIMGLGYVFSMLGIDIRSCFDVGLAKYVTSFRAAAYAALDLAVPAVIKGTRDNQHEVAGIRSFTSSYAASLHLGSGYTMITVASRARGQIQSAAAVSGWM